MTRLLYEKHVPADDLLAPLFATMPPGQPEREAALLAEAFGGPAASSEDGDVAAARQGLTEEQRTRWAELATRAADEAMLPRDPEFHSALTSYLDWSSRVAAARSAEDTAAYDIAISRWDWGLAGPPAEAPAQASTPDDQPPATLPGPGETVSFETHIKPLFRERDRKSMSFAFDLWSQADLQAHAAAILERLRNGTMSCDGAWPADKIEVFQRWTESGFQP